jgi:hypothetical protein
VIAEYVALRMPGARPDDPVPRMVGHVSLALAMAAYEVWLDDSADDPAELLTVIDDSMRDLARYLSL